MINPTLMTKKYTYLLLQLILLTIHIFLFWPGELNPDSRAQYAMALQSVYSDHHPFIMSWLWRYLNVIHSGSGSLLIINLCLLHTSAWIFAKCFDQKKFKYFMMLAPFIPQIFIYSGMIWKDVAFACCYLFVCSVLSYALIRGYNLKFWHIPLLLIILLYGTMVKFQAQYLAPIVFIWMAICIVIDHTLKEVLAKIISIPTIFYGLMFGINYHGPKVQPDYSWQYVKFYDLAAISVELEQTVIPKFNQTPKYSMVELKKRFNHQRVDDLISIDPILQKGLTQQQRDELEAVWLYQVIHHPWIYLKHRFMNMAYTTLSIPQYDIVRNLINNYAAHNINLDIVLTIITRAMGLIFLAHLLTCCLSIFYVVLAIKTWRIIKASIPLFFMNLISLSMLCALFFCTMAGTPRYTYIVVCLTNCTHIFAWQAFQSLKQKRDSKTILS